MSNKHCIRSNHPENSDSTPSSNRTSGFIQTAGQLLNGLSGHTSPYVSAANCQQQSIAQGRRRQLTSPTRRNRPHLQDQFPALKQVGMCKPTTVPILTVQRRTAHIPVCARNTRSLHRKALPPFQHQGALLEDR